MTVTRLIVENDIISEYGYDRDKNITALQTVMGSGVLNRACSSGALDVGYSGGVLDQYNSSSIGELIDSSNQSGILARIQGDTLLGNRGASLLGNQGGTLPGDQGGTGIESGQNNPIILTDNRYTFNANGSCLTKNKIAGLTAYSYNEINQLVKVAYPTYQEEIFYDRTGNCTRRISGNLEEQYTYDQRNRLTQLTIAGQGTTNSIAYEYDGQGNLTKDEKATYQYDAFNRMDIAQIFDGNIQINHYDGEGLRHEMEENGKLARFLFDGSKVVAETTSEGTLTRYVRGYELVSADCEKAKTYYHYCSDELGSITHVVQGDSKESDNSGAIESQKQIGNTKSIGTTKSLHSRILNHYEYDAFGNTITCEETVSNRFRFAGEQYDSITAQYYLRARFYNPVIGRFLQEDTYYGDGLNLYIYGLNNPVYYTDQSGHEVMSPTERRYHDVGADPETAKLASECYPNGKAKADLYNKYRDMGYNPADAKKLADYEIIHGTEKAENYAVDNSIDADDNMLKLQPGYGSKGGLNSERVEYYLRQSRNNVESDTAILGSTGKYDVIAENKGYTYFKMEDDVWASLEKEATNNYDEIWKVNQQFIDELIASNKKILLSDDPNKGYYFSDGSKRFYQRELDYLSRKGYIFKEISDGIWEAIKK